MRYHYKKPAMATHYYGEVYKCDHPLYDRCSLFKIGNKGLAVVQQRCKSKRTHWDAIDKDLNDQLYLHPKFKHLFDEIAAEPKDGLYPTIPIRKLMWALNMKPLPKHRWETTFDRKLL